LICSGFHFYRTPLSQFFKLFPLRPQTLLSTRVSPAKHISYWHRPHTSKTRLPVLFIHGIGIGLYPYTNFLRELNPTEGIEDGGPDNQVGIIAIEIMPVSFRITQPALSKDAMCGEILSILKHHGWDKCVLVSHSYGTVVSTHLLKHPLTAPRIGPVMLIDPVSILLHLPDVAFNFTRRTPKYANEHQLWYFASMDMGVSHTLSRHFFWNENVLWKADLQNRNVTVSLAGRDLIVNTEAVARYLTSPDSKWTEQMDKYPAAATDNDNRVGDGRSEFMDRKWVGRGIDVLWFDDLDHAQVFDTAATRRPLVRAIREYSLQGARASE
jgi:pimeloyl-ACP methyl ester carboxylesterase